MESHIRLTRRPRRAVPLLAFVSWTLLAGATTPIRAETRGPAPVLTVAGRPAGPLPEGSYRWTALDPAEAGGGLTGRLLRLELALIGAPYHLEVGLRGLPATLDVLVNDATVASQISTARDSLIACDVDLRTPAHRLEIIIKPNVGHRVEVRSMTVARRKEGLGKAIPLGTTDYPDTTLSARGGVRACCDYLVRYQLSDGTFDDRDPSWLTAAYCVRALLAGYEILLDERYLEAARRTLSMFVMEQEPDGGWCSRALSSRQEAPCPGRSLADLGVMTACLPLVSRFVEPQATMLYLNAHGAFVEGILAGYEEESRSFLATARGEDDRVAATQGMALTALFEATGDSTFLHRAETAVWETVMDWQRISTASRDPASLFPYLDAMCWMRRATNDKVLRGRIDEVLRAVMGTAGRSTLPSEMVAILVEARRQLGGTPQIDRTIAARLDDLASPRGRSERGVLTFPYPASTQESAPRDRGRSPVLETAMAAMTFAQAVAPGVLFRVP